ncbi:hypothetical protein [Pseudactinotalea terrae]|uniref:hypothetical protein n=1 Tax=Pseudactinotalea terrae TaxID=1743262 RepID=UPI0012E14194|nr:hypothetical protein [Pseudactinotalea terrae]
MTDELNYAARLAAATTVQGLDPVVAALTDLGIQIEVEDTGGLTLAAVAPTEDGVVAITHEGVDLEDFTYLVATYRHPAWVEGGEPLTMRSVTGLDVIAREVAAGLQLLSTTR